MGNTDNATIRAVYVLASNFEIDEKVLEKFTLHYSMKVKAMFDFLNTPEDIGPSRWTRLKLGFKDTDRLRHASVAQRCC